MREKEGIDGMTATDKKQESSLLEKLEDRFIQHTERHPALEWSVVEARLLEAADRLAVIREMENSGGEPDLVFLDEDRSRFFYVDCSAETPVGRRSLCYDEAALQARKKNPPLASAESMARDIGIQILNEEQYRRLQLVGPFDQKTSSWLATEKELRDLGGALFGDYRYGRVFTYHNGADSYYGSRGFRGYIEI